MTARIDLTTVQRLTGSFPNDGWNALESRIFFQDSNGKHRSDWSPIANLDGIGGVYAILLPVKWFAPERTVPLHAPHRHNGEKILFSFTLEALLNDGHGVAYVGRTSNLRQRWGGHLSRGKRKDGGQVKYGLLDCGFASDPESALLKLRQNARIVYTVLSGPENCANRDVLEMALCARFVPPFNIKSER